MKFVKKTTYYTGTVHEFNLPTGWTCPAAEECLVKVIRETGKFHNKSKAYRCYAASAERFPGVRNHRWTNFEAAAAGQKIIIPRQAKAVRIHASGDFFNQEYFDQWIETARNHPNVEFWAYTKSLNYWVKRKDQIPENLTLTASYGGRHDRLIEEHGLKNVKVYPTAKEVPADRPIDTNDDWARRKNINFALVDNYAKPEKQLNY